MKENKKKTKVKVVDPAEIPEPVASQDFTEYYLVALDRHGEEIPGSEFRVGARTYARAYSDPKKFKVKKKF